MTLALRILGAALVAFALLVGGSAPDGPVRIEEYRAGYRVLQGDFHAHTRFSDGVVSPCDLVLLARRRGLDVIAVTEHNTVFPAQLARHCARFVDDAPIVVVGEEVTRRDLHMLALGIERDVDARLPASAVVDAVHAQGGVVVVAHPTKRFWPAIRPICDSIDGVEVVHPIAYGKGGSLGRWSEMVEFARSECGAGGSSALGASSKAMIGNSDYHAGSVLGIVRTFVFVSEPNAVGVVDAIREGRTVTIAPDGTAFGPDALVKSLEAEPLTSRPTDYGYQSRGLLDWIARVAGLFGAVVLVVVGRSARKREQHPDDDAEGDRDDRDDRPQPG